MASIINTANASGFKGCFPIGTGEQTGPNFCNSLPPPADPITSAILPGYSLMTNATSATGLEWNFSGVGTSGIKQYKFPANATPNPFPTPAEAGSDIVLVQREDVVTNGFGLQDLSMPILGAQGFIPEHNLPSLCDPTNGVVFFFDRANAAINVYNIATNTWRIGWLKAVTTQTFSWRAASLLTPDYVNALYSEPYTGAGIFLSAASSNWKSNDPATNVSGIPSNFIFVRYSVVAGEIQPVVAADITDVTGGAGTGDWAVSAICAVDCNRVRYTIPSFAPAVNQIVCAFAVDETSALTLAPTGLSYGWWGFMGRVASGGAKTALNVNLSIATNYASVQDWTISSVTNTQSGYIQSISVGTVGSSNEGQFFLGGNFFRLKFNNVAVTRDFGGNTQTSSVAMLYLYPPVNAPTIANYTFIGQTTTPPTAVVNWRGRVIQSNYKNDYFYFCGSFVAPPSIYTDTYIEGRNTDTTVTSLIPVTTNYNYQIAQSGITQGISAFIGVRNEALGGTLTSLAIQMPLEVAFPNSLFGVLGNSTDAGLCYSITPQNGNLTQASYPLLQIGGSMNVPLQYFSTPVADFETKLRVVPNSFWYSSIEFYVETAITVNIVAKVFVASSTAATAQFQYSLQNVTLVPGLNTIPVYGGGTAPLNGNIMNSNIVSSVAGVVPLGSTPNYMRATLYFYEGGDFTFTIPENVVLGINQKNGAQPFEYVWNLNGYPIQTAISNNYFSPAATNASYLASTNPNRRRLNFANLSVAVPITGDVLQVQLIPINQLITRQLVATSPTSIGLVVSANIVRDFVGNATNSGMINAFQPRVVYEIPKLTGGVVSQPTFSVFGNTEEEVFKIGWANQDQVAFGVYTSFAQYQALPYTVIADTTAPVFAGEFAFLNAQSIFIDSINTLRINQQDSISIGTVDWSKVGAGDTITIQDATNLTNRNVYIVNAPVAAPINSFYSISVNLISGSTIFAPTTRIQITASLIRDPEAQPLVLKESLGFYLLGNGYNSAQRDIFVSSYTNTGKAYRYVPNYDESVLLFSSEVYVGGTGVDNTFTADALVFNTNYSSALLSKSDVDETKWVVTSTYGSIGYSNLSK
jgi:hypothetical protein